MESLEKINDGILRAVIKQLGGDAEHLANGDIANGLDAGWAGFTYYEECTSFVDSNRNRLIDYLVGMADELGTTPWQLALDFCRRNDIVASYSDTEIVMRLFCARECDGVENIDSVLSWFLLVIACDYWNALTPEQHKKFYDYE